MNVLKVSRLKAVLDRARNAGQVEETVTIAGLDLVLSSLPAGAYSSILEEMKDISEHAYATEYQVEHVCRSIVEVDGQSLRDVAFIEVDAEAGAQPLKLERHQWVRENLVATWSREMVQVCFRKVLDAIQTAEDKANAGVKFKIAAESDEEKYRRVLGELKEAGAELPGDMRQAILKEEGLLVASSMAEFEAVDQRARTWAQPEEEALSAEPVETNEPPAAPRAPQQIVRAVANQAPAEPSETKERPPSVSSTRVPLNQTPIRDPVPSHGEPSVVSANARGFVPPPDQVHDLSAKAERFAAVESLQDNDEVVVMQHESKLDPASAGAILDRPPTVGINSKYVSPAGLNPRAARR